MAELQSKLNELRGQLGVLEERYAQALFEAETTKSDTTQKSLQSIETRINAVSAGIFRLSNATNRKLRALSDQAKQLSSNSSLLRGEIMLSNKAISQTDQAKADALADQMDLEVRTTTISFMYHIVAIILVGLMAVKLKAPTD